jgi:hypothetical protein
MGAKVKILIAGDTHGDLTHCQYLVRTAKAEKCDRVFVLGDWGYWEHIDQGVLFCDRLDLYCNINNIPVYFLDGNHDKTSLLVDSYHDQPDDEGFLLVRPHLRYAGRGHRWTWDHVSFISLGGAYSTDKASRLAWEAKKKRPEASWFPEEEMTDEDMAKILAADPSPVDVMLTHDKPRCSNPGWNRKNILECLPNQDRIQSAVRQLTPSRLYHGHLHWNYHQFAPYSDHEGLHRELEVQGLSPNPSAQEYREYQKSHSWIVLDTNEINDLRKRSEA